VWHDFLENPGHSEAYLQLLCQRNLDGSSRYWGDLLTGGITGSRLFSLQGAPDTEKTREEANIYIKEALGKLEAKGAVDVSFLGEQKGVLSIKIQIKEGH